MLRTLPALALFLGVLSSAIASSSDLPVRGLSIECPNSSQLDRFVAFVHEELAPRGINLLVLRVDYNFEYQSHPELRSPNPLSLDEVKRLVSMGKRDGIRIIPQINLLGHQSWHGSLGRLLSVYPEFDETPHVELPEDFSWPNPDGLYCKSYCPLHPGVHEVVFGLMDELLDAFEADAFHAGLDEVFYIGDEKCPRCSGRDKAELFAGEVAKIRDHLAKSDRELWIWGDRLLDAHTTGLGIWEASDSETHRAIDLIPKDVTICDWHYDRAEPTPSYFALKGFPVVASPFNKPEVAKQQLEQAIAFREQANPTLAKRHLGILHTYWSGSKKFMDVYENRGEASAKDLGPIEALEALFPKPPSQ